MRRTVVRSRVHLSGSDSRKTHPRMNLLDSLINSGNHWVVVSIGLLLIALPIVKAKRGRTGISGDYFFRRDGPVSFIAILVGQTALGLCFVFLAMLRLAQRPFLSH